MKYNIISTLTLDHINDDFINFINKNQKIIIRFNGSHIKIEELIKYENIFKKINNKVLIDLPCNKVRYKTGKKIVKIDKGKKYKLYKKNFNLPYVFNFIKKNNFLYMNDKLLKFEILNIFEKYIDVKSYDDGYIYNNRGLVFDKLSSNLNLFTDRDYELIEYINKSNSIDYAGVSFIRNNKDINLAKKIIKKDLIFKLETPSAISNIHCFLNHKGHILIDRGDLISFFGINKIEKIIDKVISNLKKNKIIIATQLYYSHLGYKQPSISDLIILNKYCNFKNIYGFQLSEETALSKDPKTIIESFNQTLSLLKKI